LSTLYYNVYMTNTKVLNARISKQLYEKISDKAKKNRVSVSNLIRNLMEDALEIHEDLHDAIDQKIRKYLSEDDKKNVLGYQEVVLAKDTECDNCGKSLRANESAYFAFFEDSDTKALLCLKCKNDTSQPKEAHSHENPSSH
jgi:Fe-S cluster biosynthesis and repair protein YggX